MPLEMALDLAVLGLYDIFIYAGEGLAPTGTPLTLSNQLLQAAPACPVL